VTDTADAVQQLLDIEAIKQARASTGYASIRSTDRTRVRTRQSSVPNIPSVPAL
jgi:hypothetical protein